VKAASDGIVGLSKTKGGDLLVCVDPKTAASAPLIEVIGMAMGDNAFVREMVQFQKIVFQDLDELAKSEDETEAIFNPSRSVPSCSKHLPECHHVARFFIFICRREGEGRLYLRLRFFSVSFK